MTRVSLLLLTSILAGGVALPALAQTAPVAAPATAPAPVPPAPPATPPVPAPPAATPPQTTIAPMAAKPDEAAAAESRQRVRTADEQAMFEAHLAGLRAGLTLTPEQDKMWPAVEQAIRGVKAMRETLGDEKSDRRQDAEEDGQEPIVALKVLSEHLLLRGNALKALADAAEPLFATLSEEQKDRLPMLLRDMTPRRGPVAHMVDDLADQGGPDNGMDAGPPMRNHGPRDRDADRHPGRWDHRDRFDHDGMDDHEMHRGDRADMDGRDPEMRHHPRWDRRDHQTDGEDDQDN